MMRPRATAGSRRALATLALGGAVLSSLALPPAAGAGSAGAGTVAVVAEVDERGPLPASTVRSVLWHALHTSHGHDAVFLDALDATAVETMRGTTMTTLLHVDVDWHPDAAKVERPGEAPFLVGGHYPVIVATEYALEGEALVARYTWTTEGPVSVYHVKGDDPYRFISLPEVSLQETSSLAVEPLHAPVWRAEPDLIRIPVVIAGDDEYRAFYGEVGWRRVARRAVARANALLADAGLALDVVGHEAWDSPDTLSDLSDLLEAMHLRPIDHPTALRVGFTGQTRLAVEWQGEMEDVGRAYLPGRDVIIADQAATPGHDPAWDTAEEGVAVAHEVLHALGLPHLDEPDRLMSAVKRGMVHALTPATRDLARTAASGRFAHWDTLAAATALSQAAEAHLTDPELQFDYISDNLAYGPGVPEPGTLRPDQLSALTNVAVGRYYLKRAEEDPANAWEFQLGARVHAESALAQKPTWREARQLQRRVQAAQQAAPPAPADPRQAVSLDELTGPLYGTDDACDPTETPEAPPVCEE